MYFKITFMEVEVCNFEVEYLPFEGQMNYIVQIYRKDHRFLFHYMTPYCFRYQGDRVLGRLFYIIHFLVISSNILKIQGVAKKLHVLHNSSILIRSQEKYLCSLKIELSTVVLHIITFHSSNN